MAGTYTTAKAKLYACATAQDADLDATAFAALTWVQVKGVGNIGEWSTSDNIISYDTLDDDVSQKQKGVRNGGDPVVEVKRDFSDAGQDLLRTQANSVEYFAFKREDQDGTVMYNRGVVGGPDQPGGGREDFIVQRFTLGFVQTNVVVEPA